MSEIKSDEDEELLFEDANNSFSANLNVDGESDVMDAATIAAERAKPFDKRSLPDDAEAWKKELKLKFDKNDVKYWFNSVESQLKKHGINNQWSKKDAILPLLPDDVIEECKPILRLTEDEQGPHIYYDLKTEILSQYGPRDEDAFKKAIALKMTAKPSAFGKQLIHIICPGSKPMDGCHCAKMIYGFWEAQLSPAIKTKIAGQPFNKDTYTDLFKQADEAYLANGGGQPQPPVIGAVKSTPQTSSSSTSDTPQVSATNRGGRGGGRGGRGNRGNRGGGRGGNSQNQNLQNQNQSSSNTNNQGQNKNQKPHQRGQKASPDVPDNACSQHWKAGRNATYCSDPLVCSWVHIIAPRQST